MQGKLQVFLNETVEDAEMEAYHTSKNVELIVVTVFEGIPTKETILQEVINFRNKFRIGFLNIAYLHSIHTT